MMTYKATVNCTVQVQVQFDQMIDGSTTLVEVQALAKNSAKILIEAGLIEAMKHRRGLVLDQSIKQYLSATADTVVPGRTVIE